MPFEARWHRTEREQRQQTLFPELRLGDLNATFEVDRLRRSEGREPTSLGAATESAWIGGQFREPVPGEEETAGDPFLLKGFLNTERAALNPRYAPAGRALLAGLEHADRPRGFLMAAAEQGGALDPAAWRAGVRGFRNPSEYGLGDILERQGVGDKSLWGKARFLPDETSARDLAGFIGDTVLDPLNLVGGGLAKKPLAAALKSGARSEAGQVAGRSARRLMTEEAGTFDWDTFRSASRKSAPSYPLRAVDDWREEVAATQQAVAFWRRYIDDPDFNPSEAQFVTDPEAILSETLRDLKWAMRELKAAEKVAGITRTIKDIAPGERGSIQFGALAGRETLGAVSGGTVGYASGGTPEERRRNAVLGALAGATGGRVSRALGSRAVALSPTVPVSEAAEKLKSVISSAKPLQRQNQELLHQFRQRQAGAFTGAFQPGTGEAGFGRGLGALRGQAERVTFEPLRPQLAQTDIDAFIDTIGSSSLRPFEQVGAGTALRNILDGQVPTPSELVELEKVFPGTVKSLRDAKIVNGPAFSEYVKDVLSLPGSIVSSFDISGTRQIATYAAGHPRSVARQFRRSLDALRRESGLAAVQDDLAHRWYAPLRERAGVALADAERGLARGEGTFVSAIVNKIPGYRASQRQYAALLNLSRDDLFAKMLASYGADVGSISEAELRRWGKFVNIATGRGTALDFLESKVVGAPLLWAPRLYASRVQFPFQVLSASPVVRKEAARQLVSFVGINSALLLAGKSAGAWDVETDPRSADFGQMRIGPQRIDTWAGFRPFVNLTARLMTGERKSTRTGEISEVDRKAVLADFARSKLSPLVGAGVNLWTGENFIGEPFGPEDVPAQLLGPLFGRDLYEAVDNMGLLGVPGALLGGVGAGVTTYGSTPTDELDRLTKGGSFYAATTVEKERIKAANPELWARAVEGKSPEGQRYEEAKQASLQKQTAIDAAYQRGDIDIGKWEDATHDLTTATRAAKAEIMHEVVQEPHKVAIVEAYFRTLDAAEKPWGIDWRQFHKWENTLSLQEQATLDQYIGVGGTPFQKERRAVARELEQAGFFDLRDRVWEAVRQDQRYASTKAFESVDELEATRRRELRQEGYTGAQVEILTELFMDKVPAVAKWRETANRYEEQFIRNNPVLAARAVAYGYLNPGSLRKSERRAILAIDE